MARGAGGASGQAMVVREGHGTHTGVAVACGAGAVEGGRFWMPWEWRVRRG